MRSNALRSFVLAVAGFSTVVLTGCGLGTAAVSHSDTVVGPISGVMHGGPNPVVGARVAIYATTSTGYGVGTLLQEATANYPAAGPVAHQDTDARGGFSFAGNFTCPAGQFAYVVAYGGNTGSGNNRNSVLVSPLGSCDALYTGTAYTGPTVWIDELTTVATAYALGNFTTVTGDAVNGYTVGIGAPATNNAGTGCVTNSYYPASCSTTSAAGLKHAFANATALVSNSTGIVNATTATGAIVPAAEINALGNILQACVNSTGGGTNALGQPSTTTTAAGASHDGTICGKLFAYTSYTSNGTATGTLTAAGNTLDAMKNLVKRPTGSAATFNGTCDSNSGTGTVTAAACVFALTPPTSYYLPALTTAPTDYMLGISYPKASFATGTATGFTTAAGCVSTAGNGLLYPAYVATDINDNVLILNTDQSTPVCANVIAIGADGTVGGLSAVDNTSAGVASLAVDAWGHAIVPVKGGNGVRFYQYGAGGTADGADASLPVVATVTSPATAGATTTSAYKGFYAGVDSASKVYVASTNAINTWGYLSPTTLSHTAPVYTSVQLGATTSSLLNVTIDPNSNAFTSKSTLPIGTGNGGTTFTSGPTNNGTAFASILADTSSSLWQVLNNGATAGTSQTVIAKFPYTVAAGTVTWGTNSSATSPTYAFPINGSTTLNQGLNVSVKSGVMDGNNMMWWADFSGQATTAPAYGSFLRGYDTVNNYGTAQLTGCKLSLSNPNAITAWTIATTGTTFTTATTAPAVGAVVTLSGFATSTFFNGNVVTVTATTTTSFTVANTFGQQPGSATEAGFDQARSATACGSNQGDASYPSNTPYLFYQTRGITVDTMGNLWVANGTQGQVNEILGIAAPTLPAYVHNGTSNKP